MGKNGKSKFFTGIALVIFASLILAACQPAAGGSAAPTANAYFNPSTAVPTAVSTPAAAAESTAAVKVNDQSVDGGNLTIAEVSSPAAGWLVIHADNAGKPGPVLGYSPVQAGMNTNVMVTVDDSKATQVLFAMLHVDAGQVGVYEFPGVDAPVMVNEQMVSPAFNVTGGRASSSGGGNDDLYGEDYGKEPTGSPVSTLSSSTPGMEIKVLSQAGLGTFLVDEDEMTVYLFTNDTPGVSNCTGACLTAWPPVLTGAAPRADDGVDSSKLGTITRDDGTLQVTYNDMPLYYYISDVKEGDTTGQGVGGVWFVVAP